MLKIIIQQILKSSTMLILFMLTFCHVFCLLKDKILQVQPESLTSFCSCQRYNNSDMLVSINNIQHFCDFTVLSKCSIECSFL